MLIIIPSDSETGTLSTIAKQFEEAKYYTIASIIEGTLADTKIRKGYSTAPSAQSISDALRRMKIAAAVADRMNDETEKALLLAGIKVIKGVTGLVGDVVDWIADAGLEEFEEMMKAKLSKPIVNVAAPAKNTEGGKTAGQG